MSSSRSAIYKPSCMDIAADGAFRGILLGSAWSASFRPSIGIDLWSLHVPSSTNKEKIVERKKHTTKTNQTKTWIQSTSRKSTIATKASAPSFSSAIDGMVQTAEHKTIGIRSVLNNILSTTPKSIRYLGSNVAAFSLFISVFSGTMCESERIRKKTDWVNPFLGGCVTSGVFGLRNPNPLHMLAISFGTGVFCGGIYALQHGFGTQS